MILPQRLSRYIKELGLSYKETANSFVFDCPLCGDKGRQKLYIRKEDGLFRCFRCENSNGFKGWAEYALVELTDVPLLTIKAALYGSSREPMGLLELGMKDFLSEDEEEPELEDPLPELAWPYHCIPIEHPGSKKGQNYLASRGIPVEIASQYRIRYSPENLAVAFPVYTGESLVGWQYRTILPTRYETEDGVVELTKAWSSKDLPRHKVFMFADRLKGSDHAVICEGPIDAVKGHLFGGNVAAMGKAVSVAHVATILRAGIKQVYCGLDPDAFDELDPLITKLGDEVKVHRIVLPESNSKVDLGSLSFEQAYKVLTNAPKVEPGRLYFWMKPLQFR